MRASFASLPDAPIHRIFELMCSSCPPTAPGTCQLAPVSKRWRDLSCGVRGLRVLFEGEQQQQVDSFCAWLRLYTGQVKVLAITSPRAAAALAALAEVATAAAAAAPIKAPAAAAGGDAEAGPPPAAAAAVAQGPVPLQRLVVIAGELLLPSVYSSSLRPLLGALPSLQHLHLHLEEASGLPYDDSVKCDMVSRTVGLLSADLQQAASLTSLVLDGPSRQGEALVDDAPQVQLLSRLPTTLQSLTWHLGVEDPGQLSLGHLTRLTHLNLDHVWGEMRSSLPDDAFTALQQLLKLELAGMSISDQGLLPYKEQLVQFSPYEDTFVFEQMTSLQALSFHIALHTPVGELLHEAPQVKELGVVLFDEEDPALGAWARPWVLQQYRGLTGLQRLSLSVASTQTAPLGLCALTQLRQLSVNLYEEGDMEPADCISWALGVAGLVNLEVLTVPAVLTACSHPWLTRLSRLVVLDVWAMAQSINLASAAAHISRILAADGANSGSSSSSSSSACGSVGSTSQVRVVCFSYTHDGEQVFQLRQAVAAAVPVLPPNKHIFIGSWQQLQECGVELWPAPVAARLQQLV